MSVEFEDNSVKVKNELARNISAFLYEMGGELEARAKRESRVDTGQTAGSYQYQVVEEANSSTVYVGSPLENAIWEEYGTGEYALNGDGRKGGWVYKSLKDGKFYHTVGKTPNRPLYKSITALQPKLETLLKERLK